MSPGSILKDSLTIENNIYKWSITRKQLSFRLEQNYVKIRRIFLTKLAMGKEKPDIQGAGKSLPLK